MFPIRMPCQDTVDMFVKLGLSAVYVTPEHYEKAMLALDKNTVLVYIHSDGEDVILMGDNLIDVVKFKFRSNGSHIRA